jgi:hypothetical protein
MRQAWNRANPGLEESARQAAQQQYEQQLERSERERAEAETAGVPALRRLVGVAQGDSGQCRVARLFLLGLYNGTAWPFDLNRLRSLDLDLQADCLAVLRMDLQPRCEVQCWLEDGEALWRWMAKVESGEVESNE